MVHARRARRSPLLYAISSEKSDRLLFFAPSRVGITDEMSRMCNGRTRAQGRSYECCLRQLFPRRARSFRRNRPRRVILHIVDVGK